MYRPLGLALWLLLATIGATWARADEVDDRVARHEEEAIRLYEQRQWPESIREWEAAYQLDAQPRFLFNIGQAYRKMNLHREAVDNFQRYLEDVERPEFKHDARNRIDPTVRVDIESYISQMRSALDRIGGAGDARNHLPEPAPYLVAEEIVDAEELFAQMVREHRAGNTAVANDLNRRLEEVYRQRGDPVMLYYFARAYDQMGRKSEALQYYRRYLASDPPDSPLRREASVRFRKLTPPVPGQKFLWPGLVFGALGLAGIATGTALYFEAQRNFEQFQGPISEDEKRALRDRGQALGTGTLIGYAAGGGLVVLSAVLLGVAIKKGVRQRPPERTAPSDGLRAAVPSVPLGLQGGAGPLPGGAGLWLRGMF